MELLAGLIDSDGYMYNSQHEITIKNDRLAKDVCYLARSLGFYVNVRKKYIDFNGKELIYNRISIAGENHKIPVLIKRKMAKKRKIKKDWLMHGIRVVPCGYGKYCGIEIGGNKRHLLSNFEVTHNSTFAYNCAAWMEEAGVPVMIFPFENRLESVLRKIVEIYSRESIYDYDYREKKYVLSKTKEWIDEQIDILNQKELYFLNKKHRSNHGYFDIRLVENIVEYAVKFYNVKFIVMDHLHYFLKLSNARNPHLVIEESMRMIKQWTDDHDCHIMLNVHPHMTEDARSGKPVKLGINASKGSSAIAQECDNYIVVERPEKRKDGKDYLAARIRIEKNREMGRTGEVMFSVLENRNSFVDFNSHQETMVFQDKAAACKDSNW